MMYDSINKIFYISIRICLFVLQLKFLLKTEVITKEFL